jgi:hypothetical protein
MCSLFAICKQKLTRWFVQSRLSYTRISNTLPLTEQQS